MTDNAQENQQQVSAVSDKELNFRKAEAKYQQEIGAERARREELERKLNELTQKQQMPPEPEEDDSDPYVDHRKLDKKLAKFGQSTQSEIQKAKQQAIFQAKEELKQEMFLENHPDFYQVLEHAEKFAERSPKLAENILKMPAGFERQQLVYQTIKELGLHKDSPKEPSIQEKIDSNRRSPFYQPSGVGTAPYSSQSDYSQSGQEQAYNKMKELQARLRL